MNTEPNQIQSPAPIRNAEPYTESSYGAFGVDSPRPDVSGSDPYEDKESSALFPRLEFDDSNNRVLLMRYGHVVARKMVGDAVAHIVITGLPTTRGSAIPVGVGDKVYCEITEDASGVATSALIDVDVSWPPSVAPQLIGGSEPVGAVGKRIVQLCEVVADGDNVELNILHTGHIDQFQPSLLDNTASSGGGAGVLQKFEPTTGKWMLRRIVAGTGVTVTENANSISIAHNAASGQDLDLVTWEFVMYEADGYLTFYESAQTTVDCWRLGIYVGSFSFGSVSVPAASGGGVTLTTRNVSFVTIGI